MAKAPKEAVGTEEEIAAADVAAKSKKKKMMMFGAIGVALVVLGGGGFFVFGSKGGEDASKSAKKTIVFIEIKEMLVNLAAEPNQERQRFLKFRVVLEISDPKSAVDIKPILPRIEDTFQVFVRELRASDLEGSAGVYRLREELLRRVNIAAYPSRVDAVLFKDIVVQ